jgi:hypothetical protein
MECRPCAGDAKYTSDSPPSPTTDIPSTSVDPATRRGSSASSEDDQEAQQRRSLRAAARVALATRRKHCQPHGLVVHVLDSHDHEKRGSPLTLGSTVPIVPPVPQATEVQDAIKYNQCRSVGVKQEDWDTTNTSITLSMRGGVQAQACEGLNSDLPGNIAGPIDNSIIAQSRTATSSIHGQCLGMQSCKPSGADNSLDPSTARQLPTMTQGQRDYSEACMSEGSVNVQRCNISSGSDDKGTSRRLFISSQHPLCGHGGTLHRQALDVSTAGSLPEAACPTGIGESYCESLVSFSFGARQASSSTNLSHAECLPDTRRVPRTMDMSASMQTCKVDTTLPDDALSGVQVISEGLGNTSSSHSRSEHLWACQGAEGDEANGRKKEPLSAILDKIDAATLSKGMKTAISVQGEETPRSKASAAIQSRVACLDPDLCIASQPSRRDQEQNEVHNTSIEVSSVSKLGRIRSLPGLQTWGHDLQSQRHSHSPSMDHKSIHKSLDLANPCSQSLAESALPHAAKAIHAEEDGISTFSSPPSTHPTEMPSSGARGVVLESTALSCSSPNCTPVQQVTPADVEGSPSFTIAIVPQECSNVNRDFSGGGGTRLQEAQRESEWNPTSYLQVSMRSDANQSSTEERQSVEATMHEATPLATGKETPLAPVVLAHDTRLPVIAIPSNLMTLQATEPKKYDPLDRAIADSGPPVSGTKLVSGELRLTSAHRDLIEE